MSDSKLTIYKWIPIYIIILLPGVSLPRPSPPFLSIPPHCILLKHLLYTLNAPVKHHFIVRKPLITAWLSHFTICHTEILMAVVYYEGLNLVVDIVIVACNHVYLVLSHLILLVAHAFQIMHQILRVRHLYPRSERGFNRYQVVVLVFYGCDVFESEVSVLVVSFVLRHQH